MNTPVKARAGLVRARDERQEGRTAPGRLSRTLATFAIYTIGAFALLHHRGLLDGSAYLGQGADPSLYIWMFRFLPAAIAHFQNPVVLAPAWAPAGLNIAEATTTPGLALIAWPITALAGPIVAFNIISIAAPALAAFAGFLFALAYTQDWSAAFLAGWAFGFSAYVFGALLGHLQVDFVAFVPLAFLIVAARTRGRLGIVGFISSLALVLIAQFLTSLETFVTEIIFLTLFVIVSEAVRPGGVARLTRLSSENLLVGLIAAYVATGLVTSPVILAFLRDYGRIPHLLQNGGYYATDLLNFVIPTPVTWLGGRAALPVTRAFAGNWSEELGYVGAPLLLLAAFACWYSRNRREAWPLIAVLTVALIFTLGPRLHVRGHMMISLPWDVIEKLPLMGNVLPSRLMVFVLLPLVSLCAFWVGQFQRGRPLILVAFAASVLVTLPSPLVHANGWWNSPVPKAPLFAAGRYRDLIGKGETVLFLPFEPDGSNAMFWQVEADGYFRMTDGYGNFIPSELAQWPAARMLAGGMPAPGFAEAFDQFAKAEAIDRVVVPENLMPIWAQPLTEAGWKMRYRGKMSVFSWPAAARAAVVVENPVDSRFAFEAAHLAALKRAAKCLLSRGKEEVDPAAAVAARCLPAAFDAAPGQRARGNWDRLSGWLGRFRGGIGIGLDTDGAVAARLAATTGPGLERIYYPFPHVYRPKAKPASRGQLLEVFSPRAFVSNDPRQGAEARP